jgi:hypothetical protein
MNCFHHLGRAVEHQPGQPGDRCRGGLPSRLFRAKPSGEAALHERLSKWLKK